LTIIGYSFKSINAERKEVKKGSFTRININSTPKIVSVREKNVPFMQNKNSLVIDFNFTTTYEPKVAEFSISGEVIYSTNDTKKAMKIWNKDKTLPEEIDNEIKNFLLRKCITLGINLSESLQLPPPLSFPVIGVKENKTSYIG